MVSKELSRRTFVAGSAAVSVSGLAARAVAQEGSASPVASPQGGVGTPAEFSSATNWPTQNGDLQATRVMRETAISTENVDQLGVAWAAPIETESGFGALVAPAIIVDDLVYQQDAMSNVFVFNKATGEEVFRKEFNEAVTSGGPNGVAVAYGKAYFNVGVGTIQAIDAMTGDDVWETEIVGSMGEGVCLAPLVHANKVYVSTVPGNPDEGMYQGGQRGIFYALDAETGEIVWEWETVPEDLWGNPEVNSGGGLWQPPTVDGMGNVYLSVANAAPFPGTEEFPNTESRPGENPYTNHLVSLNEETGELNWAYSITGHDMFDLDHHLAPISAMVPIDGEERHVTLSTGKHGIVVCADAMTGEELWRNPIGVHQNDDAEEVGEIAEGDEIEVLPGSQGGNQMPFAFKDNVLYIPNNTIPSYFTSTSYTSAIPIAGTEGTGTMFALDASTGDILWETETPSPLFGGAVVMNDVVFSAALDGIVRGFNIETGEVVFTYQLSAGVVAPLTASGDYLFVPAGTVLSPREDSVEPLPAFQAALFALTIGGNQELLTASPAAEQATPEDDEGAAAGHTDGGVVVSAIDIAFEPGNFAIAADTDVTITVQNNGMLQHDLLIENTDFGTDLLNGGDAQEIVVSLPAGEYIYYCSVAGHREAGMVGTLTVE